MLIQGIVVKQLCLNGFTPYKYTCNKKVTVKEISRGLSLN